MDHAQCQAIAEAASRCGGAKECASRSHKATLQQAAQVDSFGERGCSFSTIFNDSHLICEFCPAIIHCCDIVS